MGNLVQEFNDYRTRMNEVILSKDNLVIKRLWNLDTNTYAAGAPMKREPTEREPIDSVRNSERGKPCAPCGAACECSNKCGVYRIGYSRGDAVALPHSLLRRRCG